MERRKRSAARVIVLDDYGRVLLIEVRGIEPAGPVWVTPGGGIEAGERAIDAAVRELAEETGLQVRSRELTGPVALSRGDWEWKGEALHSENWFYVLRTGAFELDPSGWSEEEREFHSGWRWWTPAEIEVSDEPVRPSGLAPLIRLLLRGAWESDLRELSWSS